MTPSFTVDENDFDCLGEIKRYVIGTGQAHVLMLFISAILVLTLFAGIMNTCIRQKSSMTDKNTDYIKWIKNIHIYNINTHNTTHSSQKQSMQS